jgi:hypothetical protein
VQGTVVASAVGMQIAIRVLQVQLYFAQCMVVVSVVCIQAAVIRVL